MHFFGKARSGGNASMEVRNIGRDIGKAMSKVLRKKQKHNLHAKQSVWRSLVAHSITKTVKA